MEPAECGAQDGGMHTSRTNVDNSTCDSRVFGEVAHIAHALVSLVENLLPNLNLVAEMAKIAADTLIWRH